MAYWKELVAFKLKIGLRTRLKAGVYSCWLHCQMLDIFPVLWKVVDISPIHIALHIKQLSTITIFMLPWLP